MHINICVFVYAVKSLNCGKGRVDSLLRASTSAEGMRKVVGEPGKGQVPQGRKGLAGPGGYSSEAISFSIWSSCSFTL